MNGTGPAFLRSAQVMQRYSLSRTSLWRHVQDGTFPAPTKLLGGRALFWKVADLELWEASKAPEVSRHLPGLQVVAGTVPEGKRADSSPSAPKDSGERQRTPSAAMQPAHAGEVPAP